jgi:glycosyltransferase involved in cell wall biosynthesis
MIERCTAVLGWRDEPTDAVEEYCQYLGEALVSYDIELKMARVSWQETGWTKALQHLREETKTFRNNWFLLQYTALAWSKRGFSLRVLRVLRELKRDGAQCAIVFHDPGPYPGTRLVDKFRRAVQMHTIREAARLADLNILTVPRDRLSWVPEDLRTAIFIPVGANLPCPEMAWGNNKKRVNRLPTVSVFSISNGAVGAEEIMRIAEAMRYTSQELGPVRLAVLGRNSESGGKQLRERLAGCSVEVVIQGILSAEDVVRNLGESDVFLFARGPISTRRGSAIAGIACGLPVVACSGWETAPPVTEAGVVLLSEDSTTEYGPALVRVLMNADLRASLRERSRQAHQRHFSWSAIAAKYAAALRKPSGDQGRSIARNDVFR